MILYVTLSSWCLTNLQQRKIAKQHVEEHEIEEFGLMNYSLHIVFLLLARRKIEGINKNVV